MRTASTSDRDEAMRRLRRSTSVVLAGAGALVVAFAGLAARSLPGHHAAKISHARVHPASTPPPLVPAQSAATPTAPAAPPAQSPAPPVVVSGGT
jgi:hypothetical protein